MTAMQSLFFFFQRNAVFHYVPFLHEELRTFLHPNWLTDADVLQ